MNILVYVSHKIKNQDQIVNLIDEEFPENKNITLTYATSLDDFISLYVDKRFSTSIVFIDEHVSNAKSVLGSLSECNCLARPTIIIYQNQTPQTLFNIASYGIISAFPFDSSLANGTLNKLTRNIANSSKGLYENTSSFGDLKIDFDSHRVFFKDQPIVFTAKEVTLLEFLARNKDKVVTRMDVMEELYFSEQDIPSGNAMEVFLTRIRDKLNRNAENFAIGHIHTIRGLGYRFSSEYEAPAPKSKKPECVP